jgi:hypothetical protein
MVPLFCCGTLGGQQIEGGGEILLIYHEVKDEKANSKH